MGIRLGSQAGIRNPGFPMLTNKEPEVGWIGFNQETLRIDTNEVNFAQRVFKFSIDSKFRCTLHPNRLSSSNVLERVSPSNAPHSTKNPPVYKEVFYVSEVVI
jgi:hypothetical protein